MNAAEYLRTAENCATWATLYEADAIVEDAAGHHSDAERYRAWAKSERNHEAYYREMAALGGDDEDDEDLEPYACTDPAHVASVNAMTGRA